MEGPEECANITLVEEFVEFQSPHGQWKKEILSGDWKDIYTQSMKDYKPANPRHSARFSREYLGNRYRCNISHSRRGWTMSLRRITEQIPAFLDLSIPIDEVMSLISKSGITLFTGAMNSGKSTTMVAAAGHLGIQKRGKTLSIEDPIEYIFQDSYFEQKEVGIDCESAEQALFEAYRENYETIIIGEIRDPETARLAVQIGLSGVHVMATLHADSPIEAISRMDSFLDEKYSKLLGQSLSGIFSQVMIRPRDHNKKIIPIYESLKVDKPVANLITKGADALPLLVAQRERQKRQSFREIARNRVRIGELGTEDVVSYLRDELEVA